MTPLFTSQNGYSSLIKISGISILPPLITDERRIQLNKYKAKAIDIEKRIKRKRASIDSGVMTGSYIDNFKNSDTLPAESSTAHELSSSNITLVENLCVNDKLSSECDSKDSFLTLALEDSEFRAFFYSTAERIFKDNNVPNENNSSCCDSSVLSESRIPVERDAYTKENSYKKVMKDSQITLLTGHHTQASNILDLEVSDHVDLTSCNDERNEIDKLQGNTNEPCREVIDKISPPERRVRRNSYTLDSPSPVLLEHMAKGNTPIGKSHEYWQIFPENKDKSLGFKTFLDTKKQRKTWNKNSNIYSPPKLEGIPNTTVPNCLSKKSNTFIKEPDKEYKHSIYSLPCSSRSSPTKLSTFAYSSDCIQSDCKYSLNSDNVFQLNISNSLKQNTELNVLQQSGIPVNCDNEINVTEKTRESTLGDVTSVMDTTSDLPLEVDAKAMPNNFPIRNISHSPNHETLVLFPPSHVVSGNSTSSRCVNESLLIQQNTDFNALTESKKPLENKKETSNDIMDDSLSVCSSSLSLSKFMPTDDHLSWPSTAEDLSALFSELQLRHDRQIAELLEMQRKEKILLSKLHSNCGSISSRSPANISVSDFSYNSAQNTEQIVKRTPCSRELFPSENSNSPVPPKEVKQIDCQHHNSESVKNASLKLTACVRGYLTRRLLKTERVQQLIDTIKESLNCAFSLQSETELRKNDLELHERLAYQLTAALYELQTIISAPVATRMAIIAADREKLRKPVSRPSSAISSATQKSLLRRQKSMHCSEKKSQESNNVKNHQIRARTKSLCLLTTSGAGRSDSSSTSSSSSSRKPWR